MHPSEVESGAGRQCLSWLGSTVDNVSMLCACHPVPTADIAKLSWLRAERLLQVLDRDIW